MYRVENTHCSILTFLKHSLLFISYYSYTVHHKEDYQNVLELQWETNSPQQNSQTHPKLSSRGSLGSDRQVGAGSAHRGPWFFVHGAGNHPRSPERGQGDSGADG